MTPAERNLLLWLAKHELEITHPLSGKGELRELIAAVEAERANAASAETTDPMLEWHDIHRT